MVSKSIKTTAPCRGQGDLELWTSLILSSSEFTFEFSSIFSFSKILKYSASTISSYIALIELPKANNRRHHKHARDRTSAGTGLRANVRAQEADILKWGYKVSAMRKEAGRCVGMLGLQLALLQGLQGHGIGRHRGNGGGGAKR